MKKTIPLMLVICSLLFGASLAQAQTKTIEKKTTKDSTGRTETTESEIITKSEDITPRTNMIVINPLKFFLFYNLTYYHKVSDVCVLGAGFQIPTISEIGGFGINLEARLHPSAKAMRGFYVAPNVSMNFLNASTIIDNESNKADAQSYSIGALLGWQWFPGDEFAIGLGIGMDYYMLSGSSNGDSFNSVDGTSPALRFDIGYAW